MPNILAQIGAINMALRQVEILASTPNPVDGESLLTWDLERFRDNPVILWGHDQDSLPLGKALKDSIVETPEGLKMTVQFASANASEQAEKVWKLVCEGVISAVSVGFEPGQAVGTEPAEDGQPVQRHYNELLEVSFVSVGKDPKAGTALLNPAAKTGQSQTKDVTTLLPVNLWNPNAPVTGEGGGGHMKAVIGGDDEKPDPKSKTNRVKRGVDGADTLGTEKDNVVDESDQDYEGQGGEDEDAVSRYLRKRDEKYAARLVHAPTRADEPAFEEQVPGGEASGLNPNDFDSEDLERGMQEESEHTDNPRIALELAMDHLTKDPEYYRKLPDARSVKTRAYTGPTTAELAKEVGGAVAQAKKSAEAIKQLKATLLKQSKMTTTQLGKLRSKAARQVRDMGGKFREQRLAKGYHLSGARSIAPRMDAMETEDVSRLDASRLGKAKRNGSGAALIPATLTRTGVLTYRNPDGTMRRELRLPDEVFNADSLAMLDDLPVIDIADHNRLISPDDWKKATLGHIARGSTKPEGEFVKSELVINDGPTLLRIDQGERTEISLGYVCRIENTSGTYKGQPFDVIQRDIRYNHAALCPPNRGRAGPEVGLRLDSKGNAGPWGIARTYTETNEKIGDTDMAIKIIRLDGQDFEYGSEGHVTKLESIVSEHTRRMDAVVAREEAVEEKDEELRKREADFLKDEEERKKHTHDEVEQRKLRDEEGEKEEAKALEEALEEERKRFMGALRTFTRALRLKGVRMSEDEEQKLDALCADPKAFERKLMVEAVTAANPKFDAKDKDDSYVRARFDAVCEGVTSSNGIHAVTQQVVNLQASHQTRTDANEPEDAVTKARREADERAKDAWKSKRA